MTSIISLITAIFSKVTWSVAGLIIASGLVAPIAPAAYTPPTQSTDQTTQIQKLTKENKALKQAAAIALVGAKSSETSIPVLPLGPVSTALDARAVYTIITLGDLPVFDHDLQIIVANAYGQFRTIPDLQYLTQTQQLELLQTIEYKYIFATAGLDMSVAQHQEMIRSQINSSIAQYQNKLVAPEAQMNSINDQYEVTVRGVKANDGLSESAKNASVGKLTAEASSKIQALQAEEDALYKAFLSSIVPIQ